MKLKAEKILLSVLVFVFAFLSSLIIDVSADTYYQSGYYTYTVTNNEATIIECDTSVSGCEIVPNELDGYTVVAIEEDAFYNCNALTDLIIGGSIKEISPFAFSYCGSLENIIVDNDNTVYSSKNGILFNKERTQLVYYPLGKTDSSYTIPDGITSIGKASFFRNNNLTCISIPEGVESIEKGAFSLCFKLNNVTFPNSLNYIGSEAFYACTKLDNVILPNKITSIGGEVFSDCDSLSNVALPKNLKTIGSYAFAGCDNLGVIEFPQSLISIGDFAFHCCNKLIKLVVHSNLETIGDRAFMMTKLHTIFYSGTEEEWNSINIYNAAGSNSVFDKCNYVYSHTPPTDMDKSLCYNICDDEISITKCYSKKEGSLVIPQFIGEYQIKSITSSAFSDCSDITAITLPDGLNTIGSYAFSNCDSLVQAFVPYSVTEIGDGAFYQCENLILSLYYSSTAKTYAIDNGIDYNLISVKYDASGDGVVNSQDLTALRKYILTDFDISPDGNCNGDDTTDLTDLVRLKKKLAGIVD